MKNLINPAFDATNYILQYYPSFPKQPGILKQIWYKVFKKINLLDRYKNEMKTYYIMKGFHGEELNQS